MLNSEQYIGVKRIVADIVHGAFTGALSVITAMVITIRRFILTILTIGKRPATVSAFYKTGENLGSAIFLLSSAGSNLLLHMIENIFGNDRFMCILDTKPFFLWLADFFCSCKKCWSACCGCCCRYRFHLSEFPLPDRLTNRTVFPLGHLRRCEQMFRIRCS